MLTTLQCNFACDYCFQGDHGDYNKHADKMSLEESARWATWIEGRLDELHPKRLTITFFGGEPLLKSAGDLRPGRARLEGVRRARASRSRIGIISNGLLLTEELVDRLLPLGLNYVKITLDGDRDTHNKMRPLRGGQGTFDRIIENIRKVAGKVRIAVGGNFDADSVESFPALLDFLKEQDFADKLVKVAFKPVDPRRAAVPKGIIPLTVVTDKPLAGTCMTAAGAGGSSICDTCSFVDEQLSHLREETKKRGFPTVDGVHMGPCEIHKKHAYTIGPNGVAVRLPWIHRGTFSLDGTHRRSERKLADVGRGAVRASGGLAQVRGLRVYSGLRGRLFGRLAHRTWRHEHADMSQAGLRIGTRIAGA